MPATSHPKAMYVLYDEELMGHDTSCSAKEKKTYRFQQTFAVEKKRHDEKKELVQRMQAKLAERRAKKDLDK